MFHHSVPSVRVVAPSRWPSGKTSSSRAADLGSIPPLPVGLFPGPVTPVTYLFLLQRSTAVQVRSSVRLMPPNQPSGRGLLPNPIAWSPDQHPTAMLTDVSRHTLGRTEGCGLGFGQLVRTHIGKCLKCKSSSDGHSDHNALCAGGR